MKHGLNEKVIDAIIQLATDCNIERVVLFGSRARGDYKERSDIDIAAYGGEIDKFGIEVDEFVPTLLKFDVVNMDKPVQNELIDSIEKEGVTIYEKI